MLAAEVVQRELGRVEDTLVVDVDHGERGLSGLRVEGFFVGGEDAVDAGADAGVGDDGVDERGWREGARGAEEGDLVRPLGDVAFGEVELAGGIVRIWGNGFQLGVGTYSGNSETSFSAGLEAMSPITTCALWFER